MSPEERTARATEARVRAMERMKADIQQLVEIRQETAEVRRDMFLHPWRLFRKR